MVRFCGDASRGREREREGTWRAEWRRDFLVGWFLVPATDLEGTSSSLDDLHAFSSIYLQDDRILFSSQLSHFCSDITISRN